MILKIEILKLVENRKKYNKFPVVINIVVKGNNKAYSFGCNSNIQLGILIIWNIIFNDIKFSKLKNNILQVSCGFINTVFLTETNKEIFLSKLREIENYISERQINKVSNNSNLNISNKKIYFSFYG